MKHRSFLSKSSEQEQHPAIETFERVMTSGVMVDCGSTEHHSGKWFGVSVAGLSVIGVESGASTYSNERRHTSKKPAHDDE